jgi:hypothetical protein
MQVSAFSLVGIDKRDHTISLVPLRSLSDQRARADGWGEKFLGSNAKQLGYELRLCSDITLGYPPHSSFPNHIHRFDSFKGSPRALKRTIAFG